MMSYTIDINGKRYELNEDFRQAIQKRAKLAYSENPRFSCWWKVNDDNDPVLVIETTGRMVPWDNLDQLEVEVQPDEPHPMESSDRTHFAITPHTFDEVPSPAGDDADKIPPKPDEVDEEMLVIWVPKHPDIEEVWDTGEAITAMYTRTEWNVQKKADQPRPYQEKPDSHDAFESLCKIHDCEVVGEQQPSDNVPDTPGQVKRKGEEAFEDGRFGGGNWHA